METADFNNQIALFLARLNQLRPIRHRLTANKRRVEYGIWRQFDWVHDPGLWNDFGQCFVGLLREVLAPEVFEDVVMEECEVKLLFLEGAHWWGQTDLRRFARFK